MIADVRPHLCSLEGHTPGSLREPLVPADGHANLGKPGLESLEAGVPRIEVELLLIPAGTSTLLDPLTIYPSYLLQFYILHQSSIKGNIIFYNTSALLPRAKLLKQLNCRRV